MAVAVAGWLAFSREEWPARAVLRTPGDTWPIAFTPDGKLFATSGSGGLIPGMAPGGVTLWDVATGARRTTWAGLDAVTGAFSPDGSLFVAVGWDAKDQSNTLRVVDAATGWERATLSKRWPSVYHVAFGPDGRSIRAVVGKTFSPEELVVWDAETGRERSSRAIERPAGANPFFAFSADGRWMAASLSGRGAISVIDLEDEHRRFRLSGPEIGPIGAHALSPDGKMLAIGHDGGTVDLWDLEGRRQVARLRGHSSSFAPLNMAFSPDGRLLGSCGDYRRPSNPLALIRYELLRVGGANAHLRSELIVWDVATGRKLGRAGGVFHVRFSPDGKTLATREGDFSSGIRDIPSP